MEATKITLVNNDKIKIQGHPDEFLEKICGDENREVINKDLISVMPIGGQGQVVISIRNIIKIELTKE